MPRLDIAGNRFGKLLVVSDVTDTLNITTSIRHWLCRCDCGETIIKRVSALTSGDTTQCKSCQIKFRSAQQKKSADITGQTIGNLTALYRIENSTKYKWKCNLCGSETLEQEGFYIKNGNTKSCGCLKLALLRSYAETSRINLVGKVFTYLTVLKYFGITHKENYYYGTYNCQCVCGNILEVRTEHLTLGEVTSCGCKTSERVSLAKGGTGIPYENLKLYEMIRKCKQYRNFIRESLKRSSGKSELSGISDEKLCVHHLTSVSTLIEKYQLTVGTFMTCKELFSLDNAIVLTETEHRLFHSTCGHKCVIADWEAYSKAVIK